jgi:DNA-binding NarL/FixJ family response regulator
MHPIRVHLGKMPRMLRAMIQNLLTSEPDFAVVPETRNGEDSLPTAHAERADVLIVSSDAPAAILAVDADGQHGRGVSLIHAPINNGTDGSTLADAVRRLLSSSASIELETEDPREA